MKLILIFGLMMLLGFVGDYLIKLASQRDSTPHHPVFLAGAFLYGSTAVGWFYLMKSHSLATVAVYYSAATIIAMAALGVLLFRESFGLRDAAGISLAILSVMLMSR